MTAFDVLKMPKDLDRDARAKWREITEMADLQPLDAELLANYCRTHSTLIDVRKQKKIQIAAKVFHTMVTAKNGSTVMHPLLIAESRLMQAGGRMLVQLGLSGNGKRQEEIRKPSKSTPPPGFFGDEPSWGWDIEKKLCSDVLPSGKTWTKQ
ncbi:P27 family phage terminase small subunit [Tunturiibacter gelidoferens]|uniref:Phage terminase small subunit n=1 Tax=Tunturiibacter gelidiferens TaxID=3069689 RepID=A0A9X0QK86_9BACT|nr:P27 family phage terminase small subunit [Edaphobacter lichenicola]MBB5331879.1 phage terminase small subunit [Edaphobacter lichenicola]